MKPVSLWLSTVVVADLAVQPLSACETPGIAYASERGQRPSGVIHRQERTARLSQYWHGLDALGLQTSQGAKVPRPRTWRFSAEDQACICFTQEPFLGAKGNAASLSLELRKTWGWLVASRCASAHLLIVVTA